MPQFPGVLPNLINFAHKNFQFSGQIRQFWAFLKNSILEYLYKYFDPHCIGKVDSKIFNFLDKSDDFEHFLKNSIFEKFLKYFDLLWVGKLDFEIFNFLDKSDDFEHFFKILFLKKFTSVLNHFVLKKLTKIFWKNQNILNIFLKNPFLKKF